MRPHLGESSRRAGFPTEQLAWEAHIRAEVWIRSFWLCYCWCVNCSVVPGALYVHLCRLGQLPSPAVYLACELHCSKLAIVPVSSAQLY